jgi:hypothetical protein
MAEKRTCSSENQGGFEWGMGLEEKEKGFGIGSSTWKNRNERMNKRQTYVTMWANRAKHH